MIIDCQDCAMYQSEHCNDCFVMAVVSNKRDEPLQIDPEHQAAIRSLQQAGLAPVLKFKRRTG